MPRNVLVSKQFKKFFFSNGRWVHRTSLIRNNFPLAFVNVDDNLEVKEYFLGLYELETIKSVTVANATKDILLRFNLSIHYSRGQTYDGASNMMVRKSGMANKLLVEHNLRPFSSISKITLLALLLKIWLHVVKY